MNKIYNWGILGAGRIAEKFCSAINYVDDSELYAIASRDIEKAKDYASRFKAKKYYDNYEDLMKDPLIDIIYIAVPHAFHFEQAVRCLQHKKAVLCEKPMSLTPAQTKEMIRVARENDVFLMEGMWTSCMPFIDRIQSIIAAGTIGTVQFLNANFGFAAPVNLDGRLYNKSLGGGSLMDVGIYPVFLSTFFFGRPSLIKANSKLTPTGVDEYTNVILEYPGGQAAHLLSSITFNTSIEAEIIGSEGRIKIENPWFKATDLTIHFNDRSTESFSMPHLSNGFEHEIKEIMHCLKNNLKESPKMPHELSIAMSEIMEDILHQSKIDYS